MPSNNNSVVAAEMPFFDIKVVWTIRFVKQVTKCMLLLIFSNNFSMGWNQFWRNICICNYCESKTKLSFTNCLNPFESFPLSFHALVFHFLVKATATAEQVCKQEFQVQNQRHFSNFSCGFLNPNYQSIIFCNLNLNFLPLLDLKRHLYTLLSWIVAFHDLSAWFVNIKWVL